MIKYIVKCTHQVSIRGVGPASSLVDIVHQRTSVKGVKRKHLRVEAGGLRWLGFPDLTCRPAQFRCRELQSDRRSFSSAQDDPVASSTHRMVGVDVGGTASNTGKLQEQDDPSDTCRSWLILGNPSYRCDNM